MADTVIKVDVQWKKGDKSIRFANGSITLANSQIEVKCETTPENMDIFSVTYRAGIDLHSDLISKVTFSNACINDKPVNISMGGSHVLSFRTNHWLGTDTYHLTWTLSQISYSEINESEAILSIPYNHLKLRFADSINDCSDFKELVIRERHYIFSEIEDANYTKVKGDFDSLSDLDELLTHLSFFYKRPVEIVKYSFDRTKNTTLRVQRFKPMNSPINTNDLYYLQYSSHSDFQSFVSESSWDSLREEERKTIAQAVFTYCKCEYVDKSLQFLLLYSILDRYAGNVKGKGHHTFMGNKLKELFNVDINKIGKCNDSTIINLGLKLQRSKEENVRNFCDLRDYMLHFTTSSEIETFLEHSELVSKMSFAVSIILLHQFGYKDISFRKQWGHLSVLSDNKQQLKNEEEP